MGVTGATPDPNGGVIDRERSGAPSGTLQENARLLVTAHLPQATLDEWEEAIRRAQRDF